MVKVSIDFTDIERIDVPSTEAIYIAYMHEQFEQSRKKLQGHHQSRSGGKKPKKRPNLKSYLQENLVDYRKGLKLLKEKGSLKFDMKDQSLSVGERNDIRAKVAKLSASIRNLPSIEFTYFAGIHRLNGPDELHRIHGRKTKDYKPPKGQGICYESVTSRVPPDDRSLVITLEVSFKFLTDLWKGKAVKYPSINHDELFSLINSNTHYGVTQDMCKSYVKSVVASVERLESNADEDSSAAEDDSSSGGPDDESKGPDGANDESPTPNIKDKTVSSEFSGHLSDKLTDLEKKQQDSTKVPSQVTGLLSSIEELNGIPTKDSAGNAAKVFEDIQQAVAIASSVNLEHKTDNVDGQGNHNKSGPSASQSKSGSSVTAVIPAVDISVPADQNKSASTSGEDQKKSGSSPGTNKTVSDSELKNSASNSERNKTVSDVNDEKSGSFPGTNKTVFDCKQNQSGSISESNKSVFDSNQKKNGSNSGINNTDSDSNQKKTGSNSGSNQNKLPGVEQNASVLSGQHNQNDAGTSGQVIQKVSGNVDESKVVNLCDGSENEDDDDDNEEDTLRLAKNRELFEKYMMGGFKQKLFYHIMIDISTVQFNPPMHQYHSGKSHHHILVVQCLLTKYTMFRKVSIPTCLTEVRSLLATMFGDFSFPRTVSYFQSGISFNEDRYTKSLFGTVNFSFDFKTAFGNQKYRQKEKDQLSFIGTIHDKLFGKLFIDDMDRHISCEVETNLFLDKDLSMAVNRFTDKVQSIWKEDNAVHFHYPSAQLHVNVMKNFFYGPAERSDFPFEGKFQSPFEKMFQRSAFVHKYPKTKGKPYATTNFWMGSNKSFMNSDEYCSKVKDQKRKDDSPSHYVNYGTLQKNLKRMYSVKSAEECLYPPILMPSSYSSNLRNNLVLDNDESRLKEIMETRDTKFLPVGIINQNHSCALNAVFRFLQDIPHMNVIMNRVVKSMISHSSKSYNNEASLLCTYVYCGRLLFEKCSEKTKKKRNISIATLSTALGNKVQHHGHSHNDLIDLEQDECAGQVLRVLLNFLSKELNSVQSYESKLFSTLFKKSFQETYECRLCQDSRWTTNFGDTEDNYTMTVSVPKTVDKDLMCLYNPTEEDCFDIHLFDVIRFSSKNFNRPVENLKECRQREGEKFPVPGNLSKCSITKQTTFTESPPYVIVELNRTHIVSKAFGADDSFETEIHETSVKVPTCLKIFVRQTAFVSMYVKYSFVSAICHENGGKKNAHYYVLKPHSENEFLKVSDTHVTKLENKVGKEILYKKSTLLLFRKEELKPPDIIGHDGSTEFPYCEEVKQLASAINRNPNNRLKRSLRNVNHKVDNKSQKITRSSSTNHQLVRDQDVTTISKPKHESGMTFARSMGYHTYFWHTEKDDSTIFEQPCLYCDQQTSQFIGKMTYICEACERSDENINKFKMDKFMEQSNTYSLGNCLECNAPFLNDDKYLFHTLGEYKFCSHCIAAGNCSCFVCCKTSDYKASDDINNLRGKYNLKQIKHNCSILEASNKHLEQKTAETKLAYDKVVDKSGNIMNDFLQRKCSPDEMKIFRKVIDVNCRYIALHQDMMLGNESFQNYFFRQGNMIMPTDVMWFYVQLCAHSVIATKNRVKVIYTDDHVERSVVASLEEYNERVNLFVGQLNDNHWYCLEVNLTVAGEVTLAYFNTDERNSHDSFLKIEECAKKYISSKKIGKKDNELKVVMDEKWREQFFKNPKEVCSIENSALYMIAFLMNRCGKLNTSVEESNMSRMKDFLCLSILTSEAFYY